MKHINQMTRKEFEALPRRKWNDDIGKFGFLIILPTRHKHDSGYRCMDFVACKTNSEPFCLLSGCSDVVHINGIGGCGEFHGSIPKLMTPIPWSIDCLMKSGLLRLFVSGHYLTAGDALSSFEIYAHKEIQKEVGK